MNPPIPVPVPVATPAAVQPVPPPAPKLDFFAGFLSYMLPGMGQISQGRVSKGVVFFVSLHALFFYGMYLGSWQNVWLAKKPREGSPISNLLGDLYDRPHFAGQFFIGMSSWPAAYQYMYFEENPKVIRMKNFQRAPTPSEISELQRNNNKTWDLGWVYTVIAGVLNLLVIYDAIAGPAFREVPKPEEKKTPEEPSKT